MASSPDLYCRSAPAARPPRPGSRLARRSDRYVGYVYQPAV